jgi:hypothetical protein
MMRVCRMFSPSFTISSVCLPGGSFCLNSGVEPAGSPSMLTFDHGSV